MITGCKEARWSHCAGNARNNIQTNAITVADATWDIGRHETHRKITKIISQ
jgi:hypothetical protein